jgi:hypothetical protein
VIDVTELMNIIRSLDIQPPIFKVYVMASDHIAGFTAFVDFRTVGGDHPSCVECHGDTAEDALTKLMNTLSANFGKCPHCGGYRGG